MKTKSIAIAIAITGMIGFLPVFAEEDSSGSDPSNEQPTGAATVTVPAQSSGRFGKPGDGADLIPALRVSGKGTITIRYRSGTISDSVARNVGPNGARFNQGPEFQTPLQEASGTAFGVVGNQWALIGAFVPESIVESPGFAAVDGTKAITPIGIMPSTLFFIGRYATVEANGPGTLFLGINDSGVADNTGGFTVRVTGPQ